MLSALHVIPSLILKTTLEVWTSIIPILWTRKLAQEMKKYAQDHTARKSLANYDTPLICNQKNSPKIQQKVQDKRNSRITTY